MKKLSIFASLLVLCTAVMAQPVKPSYAYYEGLNLSMGGALNSTTTTDTSGTTKANSTVALAKLNYTFALAYPGKLGVTATFDLKSSKVSSAENFAATAPTELTLEPGVLLINNSLLYGKLGTYSSRYEAGAAPSRSLTGTSVGVGIKHYVFGNNFIQLEWTQRKPDANGAGLSGVQFKQNSAALLVGFNF
jgi:hypothetical protein